MKTEMGRSHVMISSAFTDRSGHPKPSDIRALFDSVNDNIKDGVIDFQELKSAMGKNVSDRLVKVIFKVLNPDNGKGMHIVFEFLEFLQAIIFRIIWSHDR